MQPIIPNSKIQNASFFMSVRLIFSLFFRRFHAGLQRIESLWALKMSHDALTMNFGIMRQSV